jgi:hypothetical protein
MTKEDKFKTGLENYTKAVEKWVETVRLVGKAACLVAKVSQIGMNRFMRRIPHPRLQGGVSRLVVVCIASILPEGLRQPIKHNMPDATKPVSNNTSRDRWQTLCESPAN